MPLPIDLANVSREELTLLISDSFYDAVQQQKASAPIPAEEHSVTAQRIINRYRYPTVRKRAVQRARRILEEFTALRLSGEEAHA